MHHEASPSRRDGDAPFLRLFDPAVRADPFPIYRQLVRELPISPGPGGGVVFARYDDVAALLRDPRVSQDDRLLPPHARIYQPRPSPGMAPELAAMLEQRSFAVMDPPDHTRLRKLVSRGFTSAAIERLRPMIEALVDELLDRAASGGSFDFVKDFAHPLHVRVTCELIGFPVDNHEKYRTWTLAAMRNLDPPDTVPLSHDAEFLQSVIEQGTHFMELIEARRRMPARDDVLSMLFAAEQAGELTGDELMATVATLMVASYATVVTFLSNCMLALLRHPDQLALLRADPALAKGAVEEVLRCDPPAQYFIKVVKEELEIGGVRLLPGQPVYLLLVSASRDPAHFDEPDRFDIQRKDNKHLGWGAGIHYCLGAPLARFESMIALTRLADRLIEPALLADPPPYLDHIVFRGPAALPIGFRGIKPAAR
ncbi:MAG TPA: cytochrome P450 [Kofleriaceae bacterium]|nr:cytochrome P450 [Kofleriaceae bacterium]